MSVRNFLLACAALIAALAGAEAIVRLWHLAPPPTAYEGKTYFKAPGGRLECMNPEMDRPYFHQPLNPYKGCVFYSVNNLGFRNSRPTLAKAPAGTRRVAAVGDSFTYGFGVQEQDTFLKLLENFWNQSGKKSEVLNAAVPAAALPEYTRTLEKKILPLRPGLLLVGLNLNDVADFPTSLITETTVSFLGGTFRKKSRFLDFALYAVERKLSAGRNIASILASYTAEKKKSLRAFLADLQRKGETSGASVFVIVYPIFYDFDHYAFRPIHEDIEAALNETGIPHSDLL
ncbi:MAG TPA: hypothetical protein VIH99_05245, partial [Bdellovibrionota bacterium]